MPKTTNNKTQIHRVCLKEIYNMPLNGEVAQKL